MSLRLDARQRAILGEFGIRFYEALAPALPASPPPSSVRPPAAPALAASPLLPVQALEQVAVESSDFANFAREALLAPPAGIDAMPWELLAQTVAQCRACKLCQGRRNTVFGTGDLQADWLIVGEAPDENEDLQGQPFVGASGQLLDNMLKAVGLDRHRQAYITNVLKCRPSGNRNPEREEVAQCEPFLRRQVALLQPKIILAMGRFAVQSLLQTDEPIGKLRGRIHDYNGVAVIVTYHPAYLLRTLPEKAKAWADLCLAQQLLEQTPVS